MLILAIELIGVALVLVGVGFFSVPAAVILLGVGLVALGVAFERRGVDV